MTWIEKGWKKISGQVSCSVVPITIKHLKFLLFQLIIVNILVLNCSILQDKDFRGLSTDTMSGCLRYIYLQFLPYKNRNAITATTTI